MKRLFIVALGMALIPATGIATHAWGNYHWGRTTASFDLPIINSTTSNWDSYVFGAIQDWNMSDVLNLVEDVNGDTSNRMRRRCKAPDGGIRICNLDYGNTGWLGIAGISINTNGHIISGYTKLNDTYFSTSYYNNDDWKQSVTCQELGHNVGLDHQDEDFSNVSLYSCMDYQDPPFGSPNKHDYDQLSVIYGHLDGEDTYATSGGGDGGCNAPPGKGCNKGQTVGSSNGEIGWGVSLGRRGQQEKFMRIDPDGTRHLTFVTWAVGH